MRTIADILHDYRDDVMRLDDAVAEIESIQSLMASARITYHAADGSPRYMDTLQAVDAAGKPLEGGWLQLERLGAPAKPGGRD